MCISSYEPESINKAQGDLDPLEAQITVKWLRGIRMLFLGFDGEAE